MCGRLGEKTGIGNEPPKSGAGGWKGQVVVTHLESETRLTEKVHKNHMRAMCLWENLWKQTVGRDRT